MQLIQTDDELTVELQNFSRLMGNSIDQLAAADLVRRGVCFVPFVSGSELKFAPSRFVGYKNNTIADHEFNSAKHGDKTNRAIIRILGSQPQISDILDNEYRQYCQSINVTPTLNGSFGHPRKFWITDEVVAYVEEMALALIETDDSLSATEKMQLRRARIGQGKFRDGLIAYWKGCCVTDCSFINVLKASHIKRWRDSSNQERLDPFNGLLLSPNLDSLFDQGWISFNDDGRIVFSDLLESQHLDALGIDRRATIDLQPAHQPYLKHHRDHYLRKLE